MKKMTDRVEIERLLNMTGRTLEGLPDFYPEEQRQAIWEEIVSADEEPENCVLYQSDVIELLVGALRDALDKQPKWISVKEKAPKDRQTVYMHTSNGRTFKGTYLSHTGFERYKHGDGWVSVKNVTHWTTLPEPPEEENV